MIRLVASPDELRAVCPDGPEGCRILGAALAYGLDTPFFDAWVAGTPAGGPVAAIGRLDGAGTVVLAPGAALSGETADELAAFFRAAGFSSLLGENRLLTRLGLTPAAECVAMARPEPGAAGPGRTEPVALPPGVTAECEPSPRALWPLLAAAGGSIELPPFDGWYVDLSHRMRRGLAHAVVLRRSGEAVACAVSTGETERAALLAGVAAAEKARGQGLGAAAAALLCARLEGLGRRVFLLRASGAHEGFYRRLGFAGTRRLGSVRSF